MSYEKWRARLRGDKVVNFLIPDDQDEGYYRKPHGVKKSNGIMEIHGYTPVALFMVGGAIGGLWGAGADVRDMTEDELCDEGLWSWLVGNPVSYETYTAVAERGERWPDLNPVQTAASAINEALKAEGDGKRLAENQDAPAEGAKDAPKEPETAAEFKAVIDRLVLNSLETTAVTTEEEAAVAAGTKNMIAETRLASKKKGEEAYKPHWTAYKKLHGEWTPMLAVAETEEKRLERIVLTFRQKKRETDAAQAAQEQQRQAQEEEANQRAADRAISQGEEPPPPVVEPTPPKPPEAQKPVAPTYGTRTIKEEEKTFTTIEDEAKVCAFYRGSPELVAVLHTLIDRSLKKGEAVPGITTRKGLV